MYVYLAEDKKVDDLPEELLKLIGKYTHAMELDLSKKTKLAN
ncbi:MAG: YcgL domain-containing protein, partial [Marinicellaceae bacterium]